MTIRIVILGDDERRCTRRRRVRDRLDAGELVVTKPGLEGFALPIDRERDRLELPEPGVRIRLLPVRACDRLKLANAVLRGIPRPAGRAGPEAVLIQARR